MTVSIIVTESIVIYPYTVEALHSARTESRVLPEA